MPNKCNTHHRKTGTSTMSIINRNNDILRRIDELEIVFTKKQSRRFQYGYPAGILVLVCSISLWIIFTARLMMSRMGSLTGFLSGFLVLSIMALCFWFLFKRWNRQSIHKAQRSARKVFDDQFPAAEIEARRAAMDILYENFDKYSLAQVLIDRRHPTTASETDSSSLP
jgi:hypothetical protein